MRRACHSGFSLAELLIALAIGAFMITGILTVVQASTSSFRLQQSLGLLQENARFTADALATAIRPAAYSPNPWDGNTDVSGIAPETTDAFNAAGDRLALRRWSDRNCFDNPNPALDLQGRPRFYLLETRFQVSSSGNLARTCRYGPDIGQLVTQVNNLGLVQGVEGFQLRFAEDTDADGNANRWVRAGQWQDQNRLLGVRFALLLASPYPLIEAGSQPLQLLEETVRPPADGKLRRVFTGTVTIQGRQP